MSNFCLFLTSYISLWNLVICICNYGSIERKKGKESETIATKLLACKQIALLQNCYLQKILKQVGLLCFLKKPLGFLFYKWLMKIKMLDLPYNFILQQTDY